MPLLEHGKMLEIANYLMDNLHGNAPNNDAVTEAFKRFPRIKAAFDDYVSYDLKRAVCFQGTMQTLLVEIAEWLVNLHVSNIYILFGPPGIGKSTLAHTVASRSDDFSFLGASFFFSRDEDDRKDGKRFFTTIAYQLSKNDDEYARVLEKALGTAPGKAVLTQGPKEQLKVLILDPLREVAKSRPRLVVIVIDALDECEETDGAIILTALQQLVQESPNFKIFITSRPQPHLQRISTTHTTFHVQNIEDKISDNDIQLYLKNELSQEKVKAHFGRLREPWSASDADIEFLGHVAGKFFIIAFTAVLFILDKAAQNPGARMKILKDAFNKKSTRSDAIGDFYIAIIRSAVGSEPHVAKRFQKIVGTILLIQDPLPVKSLAKLIDLTPKDVHAILDKSRSMIILGENDAANVLHHSFVDYIMDTERCRDKDICVIAQEHHTRIAIRCLKVMNRRLKQNILGLHDPARFLENGVSVTAGGVSTDVFRTKIPAELQYACSYWVKHLEGADITDLTLVKDLETFANEHLLHWFEVLSLISKLDLAHDSLEVVVQLMKPSSPEMCELCSSAQRFISKFHALVQRSALHIYYSALPFVPTGTLLYKRYNKQLGLCWVQGGPERWDSLIATMNTGGYLERVTFSADNSRFASWDGEELGLWNTALGTADKSFKGSNLAISSDFSVVASSQDNTVTLANVGSGIHTATFQHPENVHKLTLSPDGSRLAAASFNGTVSLWNAKNGYQIATLNGFQRQLTFSQSGHRLAFISNEGDIRLWDGMNGDFIATLDDQPHQPFSMLFLHNGSQLATITQKRKVYSLKLWNSEDGGCIGAVRNVGFRLAVSPDTPLLATAGDKTVWLWGTDHANSLTPSESFDHERISSLALSRKVLAIGSFHNTVTLYHLERRAFVGTLLFQEPLALGISSDGNRLVAGSSRGTLHLWDANNATVFDSTSNDRQRRVTALCFSPNCSQLACGFENGTIDLRDTVPNRPKVTIEGGHSERITALAFCPKGEQLASGSTDKTVKLWVGAKGDLIKTLDHSFPNDITSLAFSSDILAIAASDGVRLFNRKTLHEVNYISQLGGNHIFAFSGHGSLLAASSDSNDIIVWDLQKCSSSATFRTGSPVKRITFSPDGRHLAAQVLSGDLAVFDIPNNKQVQGLTNSIHNWLSIPSWNGISVALGYEKSDGRYRLLRQFPHHGHDRVPILNIPPDFTFHDTAYGSGMYALACTDGHVLILRQVLTNHVIN